MQESEVRKNWTFCGICHRVSKTWCHTFDIFFTECKRHLVLVSVYIFC